MAQMDDFMFRQHQSSLANHSPGTHLASLGHGDSSMGMGGQPLAFGNHMAMPHADFGDNMAQFIGDAASGVVGMKNALPTSEYSNAQPFSPTPDMVHSNMGEGIHHASHGHMGQ